MQVLRNAQHATLASSLRLELTHVIFAQLASTHPVLGLWHAKNVLQDRSQAQQVPKHAKNAQQEPIQTVVRTSARSVNRVNMRQAMVSMPVQNVELESSLLQWGLFQLQHAVIALLEHTPIRQGEKQFQIVLHAMKVATQVLQEPRMRTHAKSARPVLSQRLSLKQNVKRAQQGHTEPL